MFMYAHALALSRKLNCKLYIDDTSGFFQKKNRTLDRVYGLKFFEISAPLIENKYKFDNYFTHLIKKFLRFFDYFKHKKSFLTEHKNLVFTLNKTVLGVLRNGLRPYIRDM